MEENIKNNRAFKTEKVFLNSFNKYIENCIDKNYMPNIAGFCRFTRINRDTFYAQKNYYSDTYSLIQEILEDEAINTKAVGDSLKQFYLKNKFNYKDKQEIDTKNKTNTTMTITLDRELDEWAN